MVKGEGLEWRLELAKCMFGVVQYGEKKKRRLFASSDTVGNDCSRQGRNHGPEVGGTNYNV